MSLSASRRIATLALATLLLLPATRLPAQDDEPARAAAARATEQLATLQKKLAAGSDISKRLRLDGFAAVGGRLKVTGVFLEPGFSPPKETPDPKKLRPPFDVLDDELRVIVTEAVKDVTKGKQLLFDLSGITRVEGRDHPYVVLQKAANAAAANTADQLRLDDCHFDASGTLVLVGVRGTGDATRDWLDATVKKELAKNPAALKGGKLAVSATEVKPVEWKLTPAAVQKLIAVSGNPGLERLRVDRVYLAHNPDNADPADRWTMLRLTLTGVRLGEDETDGELIGTLCRKHWEDLFKGPTRIQMNASPLLGPGVDEPITRLRKLISERPALDGVRVDAGAKFGPGGELLLAGIRPKVPDSRRAKALEVGVGECVKEVLADLSATGGVAGERYKKLGAGPGVGLSQMAEADTRKVLRELQEWARNNRDDVRFARLYFGPDGGLKLLCEAASDQDFEDARGKLREFAPEYFPRPKSGKGPLAAHPAPVNVVSAVQPTAMAPLPVVETTKIPGFTPFLRQLLATDMNKRWGAVLIERGYFDDNGRYNLRGVVDSKEQNLELAELIQSFAADPKWKAYFNPPRSKDEPLTMDVIPMAELVGRVQRVTPAYPGFDGMRIVEASYDKDANLVFGVRLVGKPKLDDARALLARLIAQHPDYSRRLVKAANPRDPKLKLVALPPEPPPPADELPDLSIGYAAAALAKGDMAKAKRWIDTGMLYFPQESAIWFLSAYYNHLQGDKELVRRDLFRVIDTEGEVDFNGPVLRKRRYLAAKDLQGEKRDELEKLWLQYSKEAKDAPRALTLTPAK